MQGLLEKFESIVNERHFGGSGELGNDLVEKILENFKDFNEIFEEIRKDTSYKQRKFRKDGKLERLCKRIPKHHHAQG